MTNTEHFAANGAARTACNIWVQSGGPTQTVSEWTQVTCGACRLEQPMVKWESPEYRLWSHQVEHLTSLAETLVAAADRLSAIVAAQKPELSDPARTALLAVPSDAEGAQVITQTTTSGVRGELRERGLIGPRGGLTRKGSILKARLDREELDALFGPE